LADVAPEPRRARQRLESKEGDSRTVKKRKRAVAGPTRLLAGRKDASCGTFRDYSEYRNEKWEKGNIQERGKKI